MSEESRQEQSSDALVLNKGMKPFPSRIAAEAALKLRNLTETHEIVTHDDGFACRRKDAKPAPDAPKEIAAKMSRNLAPRPEPQEKVFIVRFHAKGHPNDPEDVVLSVNGETLVIQRETEIPLLERYLVCARHATYQQFKQLPGEQRKKTARVEKYPFDVLGETTFEKFMSAKRDGNKLTAPVVADLSIQ